MNTKHIIEGNILLYSLNCAELVNEVQTSLNINGENSIYDETFKYYSNCANSNFYEYIFTKNVKADLIHLIFNKLRQSKTNFLSKKRYIIFHNFHFVNKMQYKQFQELFKMLSNSFVFIFTSNKQIHFLQSFFLTKFVKYTNNIFDDSYKLSIQNDCICLIKMIYLPYESIKFKSIREKLYYLLFSYQDITIILKTLCEIAILTKSDQKENITKFASMTDNMRRKGNKDIIYLEHFILLLINNDNM